MPSDLKKRKQLQKRAATQAKDNKKKAVSEDAPQKVESNGLSNGTKGPQLGTLLTKNAKMRQGSLIFFALQMKQIWRSPPSSEVSI